MQHGISEQQWLEFIDGTLPAVEIRPLRAHIAACRECAELCTELRVWHEAMTSEAARLRRAMDLPENDIYRLLTDSIDRIRLLQPAAIGGDSGWTADEGLLLLRSLMESFCGLGTAHATLQLAVRRSTIVGERQLTGRNWQLFVANLSDAVSSVCGLAAGRLVDRAGLYIASPGS